MFYMILSLLSSVFFCTSRDYYDPFRIPVIITMSVESVFPYPIATVGTTPSYTTLTIAQRELTANAFSIRTPDGTGIHGHVVLVTTPAAFATLTTTAANPGGILHPAPNNPGPVLPAFSAAVYRAWNNANINFEKYHNTDLALKKQLIAAVPNMYIKGIEDDIYGFATVSTLDLLTHLWANYGKIRPADLDHNIQRLNTPWHPPTPVEDLFTQLDSAINFSQDNNDPLGNNYAVRADYNIIQKTGLFETPCYHWRQLDLAAQDIDSFKAHFAKANLDRVTTTSEAGFHAAATISVTNSSESEDSISDMSALSSKVDFLIAALAKAQQGPSTAPTNKPKPTRHRGYCLTHRISHGIVAHTSANCKHKADGHQDLATESNQMGGSTKIWVPKAAPA